MPDRATMEAATPKCPVGPNRPGLMEDDEHCGLLLSFDPVDDFWVCPTHGNVTTPQSLVHRQGVAA